MATTQTAPRYALMDQWVILQDVSHKSAPINASTHGLTYGKKFGMENVAVVRRPTDQKKEAYPVFGEMLHSFGDEDTSFDVCAVDDWASRVSSAAQLKEDSGWVPKGARKNITSE